MGQSRDSTSSSAASKSAPFVFQAAAAFGCSLTSGLRVQPLCRLLALVEYAGRRLISREGYPFGARTVYQASVFRGPTAAPPLGMNGATSRQQISCSTIPVKLATAGG